MARQTVARKLSRQAAVTISGTTFGPDSKENTRIVAEIIENTFNGTMSALARVAEARVADEKVTMKKPSGVVGLHQCQNCEEYWLYESLGEIHKLYERVQPGEIMPSGECPKCGSVCHPVESDETVEGKDDGKE
ncbi:hypothetical protein LCGC14_0317700 [marine sediment metagenome]|uniref:Uncharacterized protein n=1 Tax=marine sediment metagenome TaxID=412755 RepID=A0A0F9W764_9ZZZZ